MSRRGLAAIGVLLSLVAGCSTAEMAETGTSVEPTPTTHPVAVSTVSTVDSVTTTTDPPTSTTQSAGATTTTASPPTTNAPPTTGGPTTAPAPGFESSVGAITADDLYASWLPGCPVPADQLRAVNVTHWGFDGQTHRGRLIVAASVAEDMVDIMHELYSARFPIELMQPVDVYDGDDNRSMAANNTSAFNCRPVTGGSSWSEHSYGRAIDVNPLVNPYVRGGTVLPPAGRRYADRSLNEPGMIHAGDDVVDAFADRGWVWGGTWSSPKDYQHFSTTGR